MPLAFTRALCLIKKNCAKANVKLGLIPHDITQAIVEAVDELNKRGFNNEHGESQFPVAVYQTGSGTSSNMNANEVIAHIAQARLGKLVHPNNHVNCSQSSNDVIPTAIQVSACLEVEHSLKPALQTLAKTVRRKAEEYHGVVKTGRTHLMDAMPLKSSDEMNAWAKQLDDYVERLDHCLVRLTKLAQGGTAVGTGINTVDCFSDIFVKAISDETGFEFKLSDNYFVSLASQDSSAELSGHLKVVSISLTKINNDLRLMNSGPLTGFAEIQLPMLQPGSSIMPGKTNPVIPESVLMVAAQVIGNDATIALAGRSGNFQLNVMLPVIAHNILESIDLLSHAAVNLSDKAISGMNLNVDRIHENLRLNPILVTALNSLIGYDKGAEIANKA